MRKLHMLLTAVLIIALSMGITCCDSSGDDTPLSSNKAITTFSFASPAAEGAISETTHSIAVTVPYGTNLAALVATFTTTGHKVKVGSIVQESGTTVNNFTLPLDYKVTAANGSTQIYTVTVTEETWQAAILKGQIKSFCIDFNWGPKGVNNFAGPGYWGDAEPAEHVAWYKKLGVNVIQTFAVSCNGYAWYKNGIIPEQPGMKHDFLPEMVKLGHENKMLVMGYFCIGANTLWGQKHPELSYGFKSEYHIPFTDEYLDYLAISIEEALTKSGMDGFMIDWVWNPSDSARNTANGGKWLEAEKKLYETLMGKKFPGEAQLGAEDKLAYERKAIERCWLRIHDAAKKVNPNCIIWLTANQVNHPSSINSLMYKQVDWMMDESGNPSAMKIISGMLGEKTKQVLCLVGWGDQHDAKKVLSDPATREYAIYGFTNPPGEYSLPLPIETYMSKPIDEFMGNDRNIAVLARFFNGKAWDYVAAK